MMLAAANSAPGVTGGVVDVFLQFGVLGAFALLSIAFYHRVWREQVQRAERAEAALSELNREVRDKVVPALVEANRAVAAAERAISDRSRGRT
jgi:hypothetical protein